MLLECHHLLPDAVGRQNPWVLFDMLDRMSEGAEDNTNEHKSDYLKIFYGEEV